MASHKDSNYRELCAELYREFSSLYSDMSARVDFNDFYIERIDNLCDRAAVALAEPESVGPTNEELDKLFQASTSDTLLSHCEAGTDWTEKLMTYREFCASARAVLARWGRPTIKPILSPGYERGDGSMDGAQLVNGEWYHPVMGCDSLQTVVDNIKSVTP